MDIQRDFAGPNLAYALELYERYRQDPGAVDAATRRYFETRTPPRAEPQALAGSVPAESLVRAVGAANLALAIRSYGHLAAQVDPLGSPPPGDPSLDPASHGLAEDDLEALPAGVVSGPAAEPAANAREAIDRLRAVYSATTGFDFAHIRLADERAWLYSAAESRRYRPPLDSRKALDLFRRLTQVEAFEHFLQRVFPGKTRFSIEGLDMLVPMLDEVIQQAIGAGICALFLGMAHRGRLNVLAHVLSKPYAQILAEFRDPVAGHNFEVRDDLGWTGDVKYHKGAARAVEEDHHAVAMLVIMPPNPSHLEHVDPVLEGMARAAATTVDLAGLPVFHERAAIPVLIHGDASFTGQGIVAETLNLSRLPGYTTAGTIHIITNNQLGFTTPAESERSTLYASDPAKGFNIPIIHVNADDPEACLEATRIAFAYRARFRKDVLIDLVGYRRYGHNEGDEPSFTQPLMYAEIDLHPSVRALWAQKLVHSGVIEEPAVEAERRRRLDDLQAILSSLTPEEELIEPRITPPVPGTARRVKTAIPLEELRALNESLRQATGDVGVNPKLQRILNRRYAALDDASEANVDWGAAEQLALATILSEGVPIRLTGQDAERGTFNQRHAVYHEVETGRAFTPLHHLPQARAAFQVVNSPLSENAALGFEYGYNIQAPRRLTIWEAQYGDFVNGGQPMVDEFIMAGRAKWEETPSLVLLLPHAYEGQGPDHSSGRLERFLQLAAEINVRIAYPTTAAQYFHLLRRQALLLESDPLPLIVMTPKSLLRQPLAASTPRELAEGGWQPVIDDPHDLAQPINVRRLILCSGKVYIDLLSSPQRAEAKAIAIARVEQLYPFPDDVAAKVLAGYPGLQELTWVQEEPENMGAWSYVQPHLLKLAGGRCPLHYVGRPPSSSPAEGSAALHAVNQRALVEQAYNLDVDVAEKEAVWLKKS